jgi:guanosine-3',5'-bis(diphosphate) 3'-pyrophosphohydrolase
LHLPSATGIDKGELFSLNSLMSGNETDGEILAEIILKACRFSAEQHKAQRRKNQARTPYINHPLAVASILWFEGRIRDGEIIAAALLHDTVEDTSTSFEELARHFGPRVGAIVAEVTDDKSLPSEERKRRQVRGAPHLSEAASLVKLADKISNLRDVNDDPPVGWSRERRLRYFRWAEDVVDGLRGTHPELESIFDDLCRSFHQSITAEP